MLSGILIGIGSFLLLGILQTVSFAIEPSMPGTYAAAAGTTAMYELVDAVRVEEELPLLYEHPKLVRAAQLKATHMAQHGYTTHNSPDGKMPLDWLTEVGYEREYGGETIIINTTDSKADIEEWLVAHRHRANLLAEQGKEVGTAFAEGKRLGKKAFYIVQLYGNIDTDSVQE